MHSQSEGYQAWWHVGMMKELGLMPCWFPSFAPVLETKVSLWCVLGSLGCPPEGNEEAAWTWGHPAKLVGLTAS